MYLSFLVEGALSNLNVIILPKMFFEKEVMKTNGISINAESQAFCK
jgi:hypothetical protein